MVDGPNPYLYCLNDPVNFVDLWGLYPEKAEPWWDKNKFKYEDEFDPYEGIGWGKYKREKLPFWKPDPGFKERFWNQFYKDRLPVISWFSYAPLPFPKGLAIGVGIEATNRALQQAAVREATRNFSSFSGTRNFVYITGYQPGYFTVANVLGKTFLVLGVAGTAADLGTAIESVIYTWRDNQ